MSAHVLHFQFQLQLRAALGPLVKEKGGGREERGRGEEEGRRRGEGRRGSERENERERGEENQSSEEFKIQGLHTHTEGLTKVL